MTSRFIDEAVITLESGRGGDGATSFHREKHVPRGGPDGADGGRGGDVVLVADRHVRTLYDVRFRGKYKAEDGTMAHQNKRGKDAGDIVIKVPIGTVVLDNETGEAIVDLNVEGARLVACRGGKGGLGNERFVSSVRQAPTISQKGAPGETLEVRLELKLIADAGLVGLPNAGKSTLLSAMSAARPKVGAYPFTTIEPNLGVANAGDSTFVIADLPGLIEGASEGHGLGHQFLKHAERTKVLVHVLDGFPIDGSDPIENYRVIEEELARYSDDLKDRARLTVMNKIDVVPKEDAEAMVAILHEAGIDAIPVSAATGEGVQGLIYTIARLLEEFVEEPVHVIVPEMRRETDDSWTAKKVGADRYQVSGERIERLVTMTRLEDKDSLRYLHRRLERIGIIAKLRELGIEEGATVEIAGWEFEYRDW